MKVSVNPPKTPVTQGSNDVAAATLPNVCKMPGPPAPFVPTPLPNIGKSGDRLKKCTTKVLFEGKKVAIEGSYYMSMGDIASKGTGGGLFNGSTHGKTEFAAPGSMDVKAQGKNIQLVGDAMTNNGNSSNATATCPGNVQVTDAFKEFVGSDTTALALCWCACEAEKQKKGKSAKAKKKKFQNLMRNIMDPKPRGSGGGPSGLKQGVLTEVTQEIRNGAGNFIGKWGAAVGTGPPAVRWDIVLTVARAPKLESLGGMADVKKIVEVKFPGDSETVNQKKMLEDMSKADRKKVTIMEVGVDCICNP